MLETTHGAGFPTPGTGRVVRVNLDGTRQVIVDGLFLPTAMRFGPDGHLYISNKGFGPPAYGPTGGTPWSHWEGLVVLVPPLPASATYMTPPPPKVKLRGNRSPVANTVTVALASAGAGAARGAAVEA